MSQPFFIMKFLDQRTGLGLSLSCDITNAHDREIKVKSLKGKDAQFVICLPWI